jgi:putative membrane protein
MTTDIAVSSAHRPSLWKGAVAGLIGGLAASWAMNQFQTALSAVSDHENEQESGEDSEDATMKAADGLSKTVLGRPLTTAEKRSAGPVLHYVFGSAVGVAYGVMAEEMPQMAMAYGAPFGTAVWIGADEIAVPAFGLSKPPAEYPLSTHASALAAHVVYGVTADLVRCTVRAILR